MPPPASMPPAGPSPCWVSSTACTSVTRALLARRVGDRRARTASARRRRARRHRSHGAPERVEQTCRGILRTAACSSRGVGGRHVGAPTPGQRIAALLAHEIEPAIVVMACLPEIRRRRAYPLLRPACSPRAASSSWRSSGCSSGPTAPRSAAPPCGPSCGAARWPPPPISSGARTRCPARWCTAAGSGTRSAIRRRTSTRRPGRLLARARRVCGHACACPAGAEHASAVNVGVRPTVELRRRRAGRGPPA